ncbi:MAG: ABC transporter ATP-binding protein [Maledivibacter sp.]|jgi:iron complex transport system ATP-binding protein|nr:ABC transporter ATP-binding protein [Maledivibacter sp.]
MKITVKDVTVKIGTKTIIEKICANISDNEFVGIVGPNGSGKSTLLKSIYRVIKPNAGFITLDDVKLDEMSLKQSAKKLGVMTQMSNFSFDFTVKEVVMMGRTPHKKLLEQDDDKDYKIVDDAMEKVGMQKYVGRKFNTLSGGEKQRVLIARAIASQPKALILDEPTNHLDIHYQISLLDVVKKLDIEVFSAMHDLNLTSTYCDKVYVMNKGRIVAYGSPKEVFTNNLLKEVFKVNAIIEENCKTGKPNIIFTGV